jgi:ribosome biogenesis SPOUT family RNA methylase Rps3
MSTPSSRSFTYVVEHLDPDLESWSILEYASIAHETHASASFFILSSVPSDFKLPPQLQSLEAADELRLESRSVEVLFDGREGRIPADRVCLLDPKAEHELTPSDAERFDVFLFGGILGDDPPRGA